MLTLPEWIFVAAVMFVTYLLYRIGKEDVVNQTKGNNMYGPVSSLEPNPQYFLFYIKPRNKYGNILVDKNIGFAYAKSYVEAVESFKEAMTMEEYSRRCPYGVQAIKPREQRGFVSVAHE
jgi:hypothetical protein